MNPSRDIEHEIQDLVDGHLSGEQERQLVERIGRDPELIDLLVSYTGLDLAISRTVKFSSINIADLQQVGKKSTPKSRQIVLAVLGAAAVIVASLFVLRLIIVPEEPPIVVLRGSPGTNYEILKTGEGPRDKEISGLFAGDGLLISQGVIELEFESGVKAILQGPAEMYLEKDHFVRQIRGKSRFRVPPSMSGFRVATADVSVIDLGTEFAIEVIEDGPDEVHVIEGRVNVSPVGNPERGVVIGASHARSIIRNGLPQTIPYQGSKFLGELPAGLPYLHFPMETDADGLLVVRGDINAEAGVYGRFVPDDTRGKSVGQLEGRFGAALGFNGSGDHVVTDWSGIGGDDPRTVAFWAKIPKGAKGYDTACVVWGYRPPEKETVNRKWNVQLALDKNTRSRYIVNATFGGLWMEGKTSLDDGEWHHVAVVYTGRNIADGMPDLRLYVDGASEAGEWVWNDPIDRLDGEVRVRTEIRDEIGAQPLCLARAMQPPPQGRSFFKGALDEVYVIAGALRPEDIRDLHNHNRFNPGPTTRRVVEVQDDARQAGPENGGKEEQ